MKGIFYCLCEGIVKLIGITYIVWITMVDRLMWYIDIAQYNYVKSGSDQCISSQL